EPTMTSGSARFLESFNMGLSSSASGRGLGSSETSAFGEQSLGQARCASTPTLLGTEDRHELRGRFFEIVVHEHVVEEPVVGDLLAGGEEPSLQALFVLAAPPAQPLQQLFHAGGQDEDGDGVRLGALYLTRPLVVDVEDDSARIAGALDFRPAGAVQVS